MSKSPGLLVRERSYTAFLVLGGIATNLLLLLAATGRTEAALVLLALACAPVALLGAFAVVQRPQRGVLLLVALIPFHGLTEVVPVPGWWKEGLVAFVFMATLIAPVEARGRVGRRLPLWSVPLAALFGLSLVSAAGVGGIQALVALKVGFVFVPLAIAIWRCPLDRRERDLVVSIMMVTGAVAAAYGIVQQILGPERLVDMGYSYLEGVRTAGGLLRSFSTFGQNFPFSAYMMLVLLVGVATSASQPRRLRSRLFFAAIPLLVAGLVSSVSRSAWIGLVVGLVYIGAVKVRPVLTGLGHAAAIAVVALLLATGYSGAFLSASSTQERIDVWRDQAGVVVSHPFGTGVGTTGKAAAQTAELTDSGTIDRDTLKPETLEVDNYYLKTVIELGPLGLWALALFLATAFWSVHRMVRAPGFDGALAAGTAAFVLAALTLSMSTTFFEGFPMDFFFWLLLAVVATTVTDDGANELVDEDRHSESHANA